MNGIETESTMMKNHLQRILRKYIQFGQRQANAFKVPNVLSVLRANNPISQEKRRRKKVQTQFSAPKWQGTASSDMCKCRSQAAPPSGMNGN